MVVNKILILLLVFASSVLWSMRVVGNSGRNYQLNYGIGLGLFGGISLWVVIVLFLFFSVWGVNNMLKSKVSDQVSYLLIMGGSMAVVLDRILWGGAVDYIQFFGMMINLADAWIVFGVMVYVLGNFEFFGRRAWKSR